MPAKKPVRKAPKKETAYQKALREGNARRNSDFARSYISNSSKKGKAIAAKAKKSSEKYQKSKWGIADNIASEILIGLTSAREVKKALRGNATKGDYARIAGNAATWMVPYGKISKGVNAVVGGKTVKAAVSSAKAKSKGGKTKTALKATKAGAGAVGRKTVRGTVKLTAMTAAGEGADRVAKRTVNTIARSKKRK